MRTRKLNRYVVLTAVGTMLVALATPVGADPYAPGGTFVDDDGNTHEGFIEAIATVGVTEGCNPPANDSFCPEADVSRGEMAAFLARGLGLTDGGGTDQFVDDDFSIFEEAIDQLAASGITKGCNPPANDRYCPTANVGRDEMAPSCGIRSMSRRVYATKLR